MRNRYGALSPFAPVALLTAVGLTLWGPTSASAQDRGEEPADSAELVKRAREWQRDFERYRESRISVVPERTGGRCDARIGTICIWFGGEGELDFPPEPTETDLARKTLIARLLQTASQIHDPWVTGQLVHYLVERGDTRRAESVATECGIVDTWWCSALLGYVMHVRGDHVAAERAFLEAVTDMPQEELQRWTSPVYIFPKDDAESFARLDEGERGRQWELFWRLSDPLFIVEGNDRLTDHLARWVEAKNHEDAAHPQMEWDEYVEETLIRYGRTVGWSRTHDAMGTLRGGGLQDTRRVVGHHHPRSRGYLFPEGFLESPSDIPPESWITAPREARTWYAPPYAPDFNALETQVGRFRRGDEMLVVGAYRPAPPASLHGPVADGDSTFAMPEEQDLGQGPFDAALFLVPEDGGEAAETWGIFPEGVFTLRAPPGRYVSSLEVLDVQGKRAWRARQGVKQVPMIRGLVAVSDLLILQAGAALPTTLEEAIPLVRPGVRVGSTERFTVVWEVYGLQVQESAQVTLGFTQGRPGFLTRVGEFLGMLEPDQPVEVTFEDAGSDQVQSAFRSVQLELPDLAPGEYTLHLRLELPGREPAITSRPIVVVP